MAPPSAARPISTPAAAPYRSAPPGTARVSSARIPRRVKRLFGPSATCRPHYSRSRRSLYEHSSQFARPWHRGAICRAEARRIYVCQSDDQASGDRWFRASDRCGRSVATWVVASTVVFRDGSFPEHLLGLYAARQQCPVEADVEEVWRLVSDVAVDHLLAVHAGPLCARHDAGAPARRDLWPSNAPRSACAH